MSQEITLPSGRKIGQGHRPFIVAEIGSNWETLEDCLYSIRMAKSCGADAVKFQAYSHEALYGVWDPEQVPGTLPLEWLPAMKAEADRAGIEFMCTAFSPELIDAVNPFVNIHKVASSDCTHKRMLERLRAIGKPVLLSTGAHGVEDIRAALAILQDVPQEVVSKPNRWKGSDIDVVLLYCIAAYPACGVDLPVIEEMGRKFGTLVGYSDHTTDFSMVPVSAVLSYGACVLEKHVTFIDAETPDSPHSLKPDDFVEMIKRIKTGQNLAGRGVTYADEYLSRFPMPMPEEKPMILRHNRRLIATRDIAEGDLLIETGKRGRIYAYDPPLTSENYKDVVGVASPEYLSNFGIYRSLKDETHAFHPFMIDEVNGRVAKRAIKAGDGIGPGDV